MLLRSIQLLRNANKEKRGQNLLEELAVYSVFIIKTNMQILFSSIINVNYASNLSFALCNELCSEVKFYHAYIQLKNIPIIDFLKVKKIVFSHFLRSSPRICESKPPQNSRKHSSQCVCKDQNLQAKKNVHENIYEP